MSRSSGLTLDLARIPVVDARILTWENKPDFSVGYIDEQSLVVDEGYHIWNLLSDSGPFSWDNYSSDLNDGYISFLIKPRDEDRNNYANFYSSEYTTEELRPFLTIEYLPEPATIFLLSLGIIFLRKRFRKVK